MKIKARTRLVAASLAAFAVAAPPLAEATNGLFQSGYGSRQIGIAGGGAAFPQDPLIAAINPAGVVYLGRKNELDLRWFSPRREYTVSPSSASGNFPPFPGPTVKSDSESFFIPSLGFSWPVGDGDDKAVGLALYGNGGMNTDYDAADTPFGLGSFAGGATPVGAGNAGVDYTQMFVNLNYSQKFADGKASWGVAGILNYSRLEMRGFGAFAPFSLDPANLSDKGHDNDTGVGARIGVQGDVSPGVTLAASYQTEIKNKFSDYGGLFPDGGKLDIPATIQVGLAAKAGPGTITADVQHLFYGGTKGVGDPGTTGLPTGCMPSAPFTTSPVASGPSCLGNDPGIGFGWDDMTVFKLGYTWSYGNDWTWRVGVSYGKQPVSAEDVTFNIIAPGVVETHLTAGFSKALAKRREFSMALMYAPENCQSGPDLFTPGQTVELCMHQIGINAGFSF